MVKKCGCGGEIKKIGKRHRFDEEFFNFSSITVLSVLNTEAGTFEGPGVARSPIFP